MIEGGIYLNVSVTFSSVRRTDCNWPPEMDCVLTPSQWAGFEYESTDEVSIIVVQDLEVSLLSRHILHEDFPGLYLPDAISMTRKHGGVVEMNNE